jgi:hypothetical protein
VKRIVLLFVLISACAADAIANEHANADDAFLEALSAGGEDLPVDRKRLAKLFSNVARTLEAEQAQIRNMQELVRTPSALRERSRQVMAARYEAYAASVERFVKHASQLRQTPQSILSLYHTLRDGQRTCWMLDLYAQLAGVWSGGGTELRAMMPSRAACGRFRTAAFLPRVEGLVGDALVEQVFQREEIRRLNEELEALEALLDDLAGIETVETEAPAAAR